MDVERLVEPLDRVVGGDLGVQVVERLLAARRRGAGRCRARRVSEASHGRNAVVVPQRAEPLVGPGEGVLEDVVGVGVAQSRKACGDRVDVARVALDELAPGLGIAVPAAARPARHRSSQDESNSTGAGNGNPVGVTADKLERAGESDWVERLGRIRPRREGRSPSGSSGVLAILVAAGIGGAATDREGALRLLAKEWYGVVILVALGLGFAAYAAWRFAQALLDRDDEGNDFEGLGERAGALAKGLFYAGLSWIAFSLVAGPRGESRDEPQQTARVFEYPLGRWLVFAFGLGLIGYGLWNGYRSITGKFQKHMKTSEMEEEVRPIVKLAGFLRARRAGWCCSRWWASSSRRRRGTTTRSKAIGIDEALAKLAHADYGRLWLALAAVGPVRVRALQRAAGALPRHLKRGERCLDVALVVVEVKREADAAVAPRRDDAALREPLDLRGGVVRLDADRARRGSPGVTTVRRRRRRTHASSSSMRAAVRSTPASSTSRRPASPA